MLCLQQITCHRSMHLFDFYQSMLCKLSRALHFPEHSVQLYLQNFYPLELIFLSAKAVWKSLQEAVYAV